MTWRSLSRYVLTVCLLGTVAAGRASAQDITPAECQAQIAALNSGTRDMRGWERIGECASTAGPALASRLRAARMETDSLYLMSLLTAATQMQEPNVWQAGVDLADDAGATVSARVVGLLVQLGQYSDVLSPFGRRSWQTLVSVPWSGLCGFDVTDQARYRSKVALPSYAYPASASHLDALAANASTPAVVRNLARCVREAMARAVPETVDPSLIFLEYVCGTKYRVRNNATKWVDVSYQVYHVSERGDLTVGPGRELVFWTHAPYAVALYYNGQLIRDAQNGQTPCPP